MPPESHTLSGVGLDGQLGEKDCRLDRLSTYRRFIRQNFVLLKASSILYLTFQFCLLYTSPSPRDQRGSRMPSSA